MENLRWILLGAGVLILLGIWLSDRLAAKRREKQDAQTLLDEEVGEGAPSAQPRFAIDDDDPLFATPDTRAPAFAAAPDESEPDTPPPWRADPEAAPEKASADEALLPPESVRETPSVEPTQPAAAKPSAEVTPQPVPVAPTESPAVVEKPDINPEPVAPTPETVPQAPEQASVPSGYSGAVSTGRELTAPQQLAVGAEQLPHVSPDDDGRVLALFVAARSGEQLPGAALKSIFARRGYVMDDNGIFHWYYNGKPVFSIANMLEPGFFDRFQMERSNTPGIAVFARLPGPIKDDVTFDILLGEAYEMGITLGARLLDESRSTLTKQTMQHLRESLIHEQQMRARGVVSR